MLKILHLADVHLDSPFRSVTYSESVKLREATRSVFSAALDYARSQGVFAVLLSGDLFDSEFYTENTVSFLTEKFASMPECRFIISPGNHDPYKYGSPYTENAFPENVYIFNSEALQELDFGEVKFYGYAFTSDSHPERPLESFKARGEAFSVLAAHTDTEKAASPYAPISEAELSFSGLDYAALGHIHTKRDILKAGNTVYAYSGCLTGRDFTEQGECGGILVTLDRKNGAKTVSAERVTFCPWVYETVTADLTGTAESGIKSVIKNALSLNAQHNGGQRLIRLVLTGRTEHPIDESSLTAEFSEFGVKETVDRTAPSYAFLGLDSDYSMSGELYRTLKPRLSSADSKERRLAERALLLGLDALNKKELK